MIQSWSNMNCVFFSSINHNNSHRAAFQRNLNTVLDTPINTYSNCHQRRSRDCILLQQASSTLTLSESYLANPSRQTIVVIWSRRVNLVLEIRFKKFFLILNLIFVGNSFYIFTLLYNIAILYIIINTYQGWQIILAFNDAPLILTVWFKYLFYSVHISKIKQNINT